MKRFGRFIIAGSAGFLVDASVLYGLLHWAGFDAFSARVAAIAAALTCTWLINRSFTFEKSGHSLTMEGARYGGVGISTSLANYGVYSALLLVVPHFPPLAAMTISSGCATVLSYTGYSRFVFGPGR